MKYRISSCLAILAIMSLLAGYGCSPSTSGDTISIKEQVKAEEGGAYEQSPGGGGIVSLS